MIGSIGAQIALLAFAAAIAAGLAAGNSPTTILCRALVAMAVALFVGKLAAWSTKLVLRDHLVRKKMKIDRAHLDAKRKKDAETEAAARSSPPEAAVETG
jgi:hypothetical protein